MKVQRTLFCFTTSMWTRQLIIENFHSSRKSSCRLFYNWNRFSHFVGFIFLIHSKSYGIGVSGVSIKEFFLEGDQPKACHITRQTTKQSFSPALRCFSIVLQLKKMKSSKFLFEFTRGKFLSVVRRESWNVKWKKYCFNCYLLLLISRKIQVPTEKNCNPQE